MIFLLKQLQLRADENGIHVILSHKFESHLYEGYFPLSSFRLVDTYLYNRTRSIDPNTFLRILHFDQYYGIYHWNLRQNVSSIYE